MEKLMARRLNVLSIAFAAASCVSAYAQATPSTCAEDRKYKQIDFLIGQWNAYEDDKKIAEVDFVKQVGGCAALETWKSMDSSGISFTALSAYSRVSNTWDYFLAGDEGTIVAINWVRQSPGHFNLQEKAGRPSGSPIRRWYVNLQPDGSVIEGGKSSTDGKIWKDDPEIRLRRRE